MITCLFAFVLSTAYWESNINLNAREIYYQKSAEISESQSLAEGPQIFVKTVVGRLRFFWRRQRIENLERFFKKYQSPLYRYSADFVDSSDLYHLDYRLLPAIAGKESTFCKSYIRSTFNCFGWGSGLYNFSDFSASIYGVGSKISRFYDVSSIEKIGNKYCPNPSCDTKDWTRQVTYFYKQIEE